MLGGRLAAEYSEMNYYWKEPKRGHIQNKRTLDGIWKAWTIILQRMMKDFLIILEGYRNAPAVKNTL